MTDTSTNTVSQELNKTSEEEKGVNDGKKEKEAVEVYKDLARKKRQIKINDTFKCIEKGTKQDLKKFVGGIPSITEPGNYGVLIQLTPEENSFEEDAQYIFERFLGKGEFGSADICKDLTKDRLFVRKSIAKHKFNQNEALTLIRLDHPNITKLYGAIVKQRETKDESVVEILMEFGGVSLKRHLEISKPMTKEQKLCMYKQIFEALVHMEKKGVIHMDLKPENLTLKGQHVMMIIDFGQARFAGESFKWANYLYSAPEVCQYVLSKSKNHPQKNAIMPKEITIKADMFSSGLVLLFDEGYYPIKESKTRQDALRERAELKEPFRMREDGFIPNLINLLTEPDPVNRLGPTEALEKTKSELKRLQEGSTDTKPPDQKEIVDHGIDYSASGACAIPFDNMSLREQQEVYMGNIRRPPVIEERASQPASTRSPDRLKPLLESQMQKVKEEKQ